MKTSWMLYSLLILVSAAEGQETTASIVGTVIDSTGAGVPGAVRPVHLGKGVPAVIGVREASLFESEKDRSSASLDLPVPEVDPCRIAETPVLLCCGSK